MKKSIKKMMGAICGTLAAVGMVICVVATECPVMPSFMAWRIVGLSLICMGIWPMAAIVILEADR